jgi:hypothetical protein
LSGLMVKWFDGWMVGLSYGWLVGLLACWMVARLDYWMVEWYGWLTCWIVVKRMVHPWQAIWRAGWQHGTTSE